MIAKDKVLLIDCLVCERQFKFMVNEDDYYHYEKSENIHGASHYFPYLPPEDHDIIDTHVCENCE